MISGIGKSGMDIARRRFVPSVTPATSRQHSERQAPEPEITAPAAVEPPPSPRQVFPGHDSGFIAQIVAMASPVDAERRRRRNPAAALPRAHDVYARSQRLVTDLEQGFFSDETL